ncbi:MAG: lipid II:glycine glycyltransferase FemX [Methanosarcinales archaeon]
MKTEDSFKITNSVKKEKWDEFVYNHPHGNIFQTPDMAEVYKRTKNYEPITLAVVDENNDEIKAILLAVVIKDLSGMLGSFSARSIIKGGPLYSDINALKILMAYYNKTIKKRALYTEIRMMFEDPQLSFLHGNGYFHEDELNFLIDLNKSKDELWSNLSKSRRKGINRAKKRGVIIEEIHDKSLIPIFYRLLRETYDRAKIPLADISLFESGFDVLVPRNKAKFFIAKYEEDYIGARFVLTYNGMVYAWYAGVLKEYSRLYSNDLLAWHAIEWGSSNGYHVFDFGGAGKPNEKYGVREFKKQFGGNLVNIGRYKKVHSPRKLWIAMKGFKVWRKKVYLLRGFLRI